LSGAQATACWLPYVARNARTPLRRNIAALPCTPTTTDVLFPIYEPA
jgi:hypothetical protein